MSFNELKLSLLLVLSCANELLGWFTMSVLEVDKFVCGLVWPIDSIF